MNGGSIAAWSEQIPDINFENFSKLRHRIESRVGLSAFDLGDVGGSGVCPLCKLSLGQLLGKATLFQPLAKKLCDGKFDVIGENYLRHGATLSKFSRQSHSY